MHMPASSEPASPVSKLAPGPRGYPWLGALPEVHRNPLELLPRLVREFGDVVRLGRFGLRPVFLVSEPSGIRHVLLENARNYNKGLNFKPLKLLAPTSTPLLEGPPWLPRRRLVQPAFHSRQLPAFGPAMEECIRETMDELAQVPAGTPVDLGATMMGLTLNIIVRTMFGSDVRAHTARITQAVSVLLEGISERMHRAINLPLGLPTPANRRFLRAKGVLDEITLRLIAERRRASQRPADLLTMLLEAKDPETGETFSEAGLHDELIAFIIAGHETTANALTWTWMLLGQHPEVRKKVEDEVDEAAGGRRPTAEDLPGLAYTRMAFCEAMRLYPPGWMMARTAIADDQVGGFTIPAGSLIFISPYVTHRREDLWPRPDAFEPERFADPSVEDPSRCRYLPFGAGPRICTARGFALMEGPLILATLAQRFRFSLVPDLAIRPNPGFTLRPAAPLWAVVERRATRSNARSTPSSVPASVVEQASLRADELSFRERKALS